MTDKENLHRICDDCANNNGGICSAKHILVEIMQRDYCSKFREESEELEEKEYCVYARAVSSIIVEATSKEEAIMKAREQYYRFDFDDFEIINAEEE